MFKWTCPFCGLKLEFPNALARDMTASNGACAGCRLQWTLANPETSAVTAAVLDFVGRKGGPASDTWKESVSPDLLQAFGLLERSDGELNRLFGIPVEVGK